MPRTDRDVEIAKMAVRLAHEHLRPLRELTGVSGASYQALVRYATQGRHGVYLDALKDNGDWVSSAEAVRRFLRAWNEVRAGKSTTAVVKTGQGG